MSHITDESDMNIAFVARLLIRLASLVPEELNVSQLGRDVELCAEVLGKGASHTSPLISPPSAKLQSLGSTSVGICVPYYAKLAGKTSCHPRLRLPRLFCDLKSRKPRMLGRRSLTD